MWVEDGTQPGYIKLNTYADGALLHQASLAVPSPRELAPATGWQRVLTPGLGRELVWRCAVWPQDATPAAIPAAFSGPEVLPRLASASTAPAARASLALVGDVMLDDAPGRLIRQGRDPFKPFAAWLDRADVRVGNLECVVARGGRADPAKPFSFRAHPRVLPVLARHLDAVALANNHSGDYGPQAFGEMLGLLQRQGLAYFGGGHNLAQAHQPLIIERHGLRIALLGYNEFMPRAFEADTARAGIAWSEDEQVWLDIQQARRQADVVIPVMHWGQEHEPLANARQRQLARLMIDAGADAVVGGHPHVTQDVEIYRGRPIIYSLGNFVFDGFSDADNNTAWLLHLQLDAQGVRSWHVVVGRIDGDGVPHPQPEQPAPCWWRGQAQAGLCRASAVGEGVLRTAGAEVGG
ncbi:MAG: poly-gamma-glutamate biosynthesis protein [Roseateles depolymerans]|uniref:Poly-gamma-glutamate biosynthesis protein n=1 Tax=Roseateles depolymerans TaxID=76731 RepID=A0A2W5FRH1_9BURK|nr:MAG: poly-gamma-glutamate biosynthesis protein [Roseateles depolymerans]